MGEYIGSILWDLTYVFGEFAKSFIYFCCVKSREGDARVGICNDWFYHYVKGFDFFI